jgi:hypothetical protein
MVIGAVGLLIWGSSGAAHFTLWAEHYDGLLT